MEVCSLPACLLQPSQAAGLAGTRVLEGGALGWTGSGLSFQVCGCEIWLIAGLGGEGVLGLTKG